MVYIVVKMEWEDRVIVGVYDNVEEAMADMADNVNKMIEVWEIGGGRVDEIYAYDGE